MAMIYWVGTIANRYSAVWLFIFGCPVFIYSAVRFRPSGPVSMRSLIRLKPNFRSKKMDSSGDNLEVLYENYSTPKRSKEKVSASKLFKNVDFTLLEVIIVILYFP